MHRIERNYLFPFMAPLTCSQREALSYESSIQPLLRSISCLFSYLFTSALFPQPLPEISNPEKEAQSKALLKAIGGESFVIGCADGSSIEGMEFSADEFALRLQKALQTQDVTEFIPGIDYSKNHYVCFEEKDALEPFVQTGAIVSVSGWLCAKQKENSTGENGEDTETKASFVERCAIPLLTNIEEQALDQTSRPTMILCPGLSAPYTLYTALIGRILLSGLDVVVYNPSGRGKSTGRPSEERWIEDAEKVYDFVQSGSYSKRILVWASCFGLIAGAKLAKRHKADLIVDRGFDRFAVIASRFLGLSIPRLMRAPITYLLEKAIMCATRHRASDLLYEIEGNVLLINDHRDEMVPRSEQCLLEESLGLSKKFIRRKMLTYVGHRSNWLIKGDAWRSLIGFFKEIGLATHSEVLQRELIEKLSKDHCLKQLMMGKCSS